MSRTFTHSSTGTVVEYPNATHFAFVPAIFKITKIPTTYDKLEMVLTDRQAQQSYSEEREPFNGDRKSTRLNSSHIEESRMPSSA